MATKVAKSYPVATSGALIVNPQKQVLLVKTHKWSDTYGIPGGKIEKGETAEQAAVREILEETGLHITVQKFAMVQDCIDPPEFYIPGSHFLLFNYVAITTDTKVTLNEEAESHVWVDPKESLKMNLNQPTRVLLEWYLGG